MRDGGGCVAAAPFALAAAALAEAAATAFKAFDLEVADGNEYEVVAGAVAGATALGEVAGAVLDTSVVNACDASVVALDAAAATVVPAAPPV